MAYRTESQRGMKVAVDAMRLVCSQCAECNPDCPLHEWRHTETPAHLWDNGKFAMAITRFCVDRCGSGATRCQDGDGAECLLQKAKWWAIRFGQVRL